MNEELITVKEYADLKGVTYVAIFKKLTGTLEKYVVEKDGKKLLNKALLEKDGLLNVNNGVKENTNEELNVIKEQLTALENANNELKEKLSKSEEEVLTLKEKVNNLNEEKLEMLTIQNASKDEYIKQMQENFDKLAILTSQFNQVSKYQLENKTSFWSKVFGKGGKNE